MTPVFVYGTAAVAILVLALGSLLLRRHLLRRILALNVLASGVFLLLVLLAYRPAGEAPDPVPHALVLTGIVIAFAATALAVTLAGRLHARTDADHLPEERT